ncbi:MAG: methyltransferase domain-containing protein [Candidatus Eisenbacteria bacterium]
MPLDRHVLYEAAVQGVDYDLDVFERIYRRHHGHRFTRLREDFCGTAAISGAWVTRRRANHAWGVDIDAGTLAWARAHRLPHLGEAGRRLTLIRGDVRSVTGPLVDVVCAMNFSYWVLKTRRELLEYFTAVRRTLRPRGLLVASAFGGTGTMETLLEKRRIGPSTTADGRQVPAFTYVWEQESFNPIDHHLRCAIHFRLRGGHTQRRAFTYDWRMWTLPEVRDLMRDAGFRDVETYVEGWDDARHRPDDVYRLRRRFENQTSWLALVVGVR